MPHVDLRWWRLAQMDSAVVSSADGMTASWYQRDPKEFARQMTRSAQLHTRLYQEWPELARRYREASRDLDLAGDVEADLRGPQDPETD